MTISAAFANTWRDEKGRFAEKGYVAADGGLVDIGDLDGELVEKSTIAELVEAYGLYENEYGPVKMDDGASLYALPGEYGEQVRYVALAEEEEGTYLEIYDDFYDVAYDIDISAQESDVYDEFLSQAKRTIVFHGTRDQDSFDSIKEGGLGTRNETRAPGANDSVGSAVFTTSNEHVAYEYGADTFVFEIDLPQAIADGVITTDNLSREPGIDEAEALSGVAYGYGDDGFNAYDGFSSMGIDPATIIISTDIPPKYLKPYGNAESLTVKSSVSFANEWRDEIGRFAPKGYTAVSSGVLVADAETLLQARNKAQAMMSAVPQPSQTAVIAHQADALLAREGWIRAGGERRGNSTKRAERLQEMADLWGDGEVMPCVHTGIMLAGNKEAALKYGLEMAQQDKLIVGPHGGGYTIDNLVPSSRAANQSRGDDTPVWLGQPEWGDPAVYASATSTANSRKIALQFQKRRKAIRSRRRDKGKSVSAPKGKLWDTKWRGEEFEPAGPQPEVSGSGDGGGVDTDVVDKYGFVGGAVDRQGGDRSGDWGRVDDVGEVGGFGVSEGQDSLVGKRSVPSERFAGGGCSVGDVHGGHDSSFGVRRAVQFANTWRDEMGRFAPKGYTATEAQAIVYEQARRNGDTPEEAARKADLPDAPRLRGDRTGDAKIDAVIDGFLDEPLGDYTTDDTPIGDLTKAQAHGMCQEVAEQFVEYAEANGLTRENGYRVYATHTNMDEIGYETQGVAEGEVMDDDGNIINGYYYDHTINEIYTDDSRWPHFVDFTARQYGYDTPVKVSFSFTDDTVELAASGVVQFANPWRDERGRFAEKGYQVNPKPGDHIYPGAAGAVTAEANEAARQGIPVPEFDGNDDIYRGIALPVTDAEMAEIHSLLQPAMTLDEVNQELYIGPMLVQKALGYEGHQGDSETSGLGRHWTTDPKMAASVKTGDAQQILTRLKSRPRQSDIRAQEVVKNGQKKIVDGDGNKADKPVGTGWSSGESEVLLKPNSPVDIVGVEILVGDSWRQVWGDIDGDGVGDHGYSARFTIDGSVQFANTWRDEMGRFAPKGYQYGPAAVGLTAGVGRGEGWDIRDGEYVVSARDRDGNVVWSDDMDLSVYFTSGMRKYRNAIEVANVMDEESADALVTELEGIQFDDLDSFLFMETSNYLRDSGLATTEGLSMAAAFQIAAWRQASGTAEIGSWEDADTISGLLGAGNISEAQEAITALYGITPQSGFIAAVNNGWAASSTSYSSLALQLHASGGKRDQLSWLSERSGAHVLDKASRLSYQMSDSFFAAARAYEDHSLNTMQALGVGDRMELWRGVQDSGVGNFVPEQNAILVNTNPLSSWSTMYSVAKGFGSAYSGAVYGQKIDPWYGKVFSFGDTTGLGAHGEWEVVMKQTDGPFRPGAIVGTEGGVFPNSPPDIVEFVAEGEPVVIHVDAVDPDWLDNWEQAVDFDDAEDAGRAEWWAKVVEGRMAGDRRPPSELAVHGSVAFANTWRDEIGRFAPKGYQASISGSDLAGMTIDGELGRITFEANGDGTYRLLYDIEQATGEDGADVEMNVAVELDENGDIVAIEAVLADRPGRRDYKDSDVEEVVRLLEEEFTGAGAELMAPDYRERSTLDPDFDEIDAQPIPDDGDFAAMLVHDLYGFEHRGERYRFDIQSAHEGWVKFDIVDDYGATVAAIERNIGETSMQNERFFMADEFQNQGIGTKFLDGFEAAVHERYDIETIGLEAVSAGRYAWASRGFEKIGGFDSTAEDWLEGMRDHVSSDAGKLSKLDVIEDSWRNYGDGVYPGELIGVDRDAAHDVLTSGRNWHGEMYVGSNPYTNWEKEFLSRPEDIIVPHGQDRPEQIPGQGELFASLTMSGGVAFANTWRDERGRFAEKGYQVSGAAPLNTKPDNGRRQSQKSVLRKSQKIADDVAEFFGSDPGNPDIAEWENPSDQIGQVVPDEYNELDGGVARYTKDGRILVNEYILEKMGDPDLGVDDYRKIAHEAVHGYVSGVDSLLPGASQSFEEGAAEILSSFYWQQRGQPYDHRDATRVPQGDGSSSGWLKDPESRLAATTVYGKEVTDLARRAASFVGGWDDREAIIREVETVMRADHMGRMSFRDSTDANYELPSGITSSDLTTTGRQTIKYLLSGDLGEMEGAEYGDPDVSLTMSGGVELSLGGEVTDTHDDPYVDPVLANRMARLWTEAYATFANTMAIELAATHTPLSSPLTASASSPMSWSAIVDEILADGLGDAFYDALVGVNVEIGFDIRDAVVERTVSDIIEHVRAFEPSIRKSTTKWLQKSLRDGLSVDAAVAALPTDSPLSPRQAYLTARTELIAASNNGAYLGYLEAGVKSKTWITARDERVREPTHTDLEGKKVDLRTDFLVGGFAASYPGDPRLPIQERIQCRCTIVPSFEPNGKKAITKKELYAQAVKREISGRSRMNKPQLQQALAADVALDAATMAQLHIISRARNIVGRYGMRKAELLAAIRAS